MFKSTKLTVAAVMVCFAIMAISSNCVLADDEWPYWSYNTGQKCLIMMNDHERLLWVRGLIDGMGLCGWLDKIKVRYILEECISDKTFIQLTATFKKHLEENPQKWDMAANLLMIDTIGTYFGHKIERNMPRKQTNANIQKENTGNKSR